VWLRPALNGRKRLVSAAFHKVPPDFSGLALRYPRIHTWRALALRDAPIPACIVDPPQFTAKDSEPLRPKDIDY
jgi:hypothetical protein